MKKKNIIICVVAAIVVTIVIVAIVLITKENGDGWFSSKASGSSTAESAEQGIDQLDVGEKSDEGITVDLDTGKVTDNRSSDTSKPNNDDSGSEDVNSVIDTEGETMDGWSPWD